MELLDLPTEVLGKIISLCGPGAVTETCRTFSDIAISIPSLWTSVRLGPSQLLSEGQELLRSRLSRTVNSLLDVSIGPVQKNMVDHSTGGIIKESCITLSRWNEQIACLKIRVEEPVDAVTILCMIFRNLTSSVIFSALQSLSLCVHNDENFPKRLIPPAVLQDFHKNFPRLQYLSIPNVGHCLRSFPQNTTFSHLHTLVLVEDEGDVMDLRAVTELLSNTPQLETLWLKHTDFDIFDPLQVWEEYGGDQPLRVFLPHLVRLAVSVPGTGLGLLHCLETPSLEDLHIDGSSPCWDGCDLTMGACTSIKEAVKSLASWSSGLRRLAYTRIYFAKGSFEWLLFGNDGHPPFPQLETLAFHECSTFGLDDPLLLRFAQRPTIPLRKLVFMTFSFCNSIQPSSLVQLYQKLIMDAPHKEYELQIYPWIYQAFWSDDDPGPLEATGVKLIQCDPDEQADRERWWDLGHRVDPSDSWAY